MNRVAIERQVRALIADVARHDVAALGADDDLVEHLGVDSLQGLQILAASRSASMSGCRTRS